MVDIDYVICRLTDWGNWLRIGEDVKLAAKAQSIGMPSPCTNKQPVYRHESAEETDLIICKLLDKKQKIAVIHYYYWEISQLESALKSGCSIATIKMRLQNSRSALLGYFIAQQVD